MLIEIFIFDAAQQIVPQLSMKGVKLAAFNKDDGVIFPWPFLWGYAQSCLKRGIKVETFTRVIGFEQSEGRIRKVITDRGEIACDTVVLAAGAWSPEIARLAGVHLPNEPHRHEICSSEPLKPFLGPLVSVLDSGLYFSQSMRGEIVGGMGDPREPAGLNLGSTSRFLTRYAQALGIEVIPVGTDLYSPSAQILCVGALEELEELGPGDAVLVKGSRIAGLDRLAATLRAR